MKKALLILASSAFVVAACGGSGGDEVVSETTEDPVTTTLSSTTTVAAPTTTTTTAAPTTTTAEPTTTTMEPPSLIPSGDPDIDAVVTAFMVAFDSTSDYVTKLPYVDDLSGLEETVANYMETGETMGGVSIIVTSVEINGDEAAVAYDLLFNANPIYPDLPGTAVRTDAGWQVPRAEFCIMMSNARVGCPAE